MAGQPARQPIAPRGVGETSLAGRYLQITYDLATGHWRLHSTSAGPAISLVATAQVELLAPDGSVEIRDVATASLTTCRQETSDDPPVRHRLRVWRDWPDGVTVCQSFELVPTSREITADLFVQPHRAPLTVRALRPIVPPVIGRPNLSLLRREDSPTVIDFGWTATEPVRWGRLGASHRGTSYGSDARPLRDEIKSQAAKADADRYVGTGIVAAGFPDEADALTLAFVDGRVAIGSFAFENCPKPVPGTTSAGKVSNGPDSQLQLTATAWFGATEVPPSGVSTGALWLGLESLELGLRHLATCVRESARSERDETTTDLVDRATSRPVPATLVTLNPSARSQVPPSEATVLDALTAANSARLAIDGAFVPEHWEQKAGDWIADTARFPHGLAAVREAIRSERWRAGLSVAPLIAARSSATFQTNPTWVVRYENGDPVVAGNNGEDFVLDPTQPEVVAWLRARSNAVTHDWGFDALRLTDLAASVESGWRSNARESPLTSLRAGIRACRDGSGNAPIIAARGPLLGLLDLVDVVETCTGPITRAEPSPLLRAFLGSAGPRASAGPVILADPDQSLDEARAAGTIAALAGGALLFDGPWKGMTTERQDLFSACLPPCRAPIFSLDPFAPGGPILFGARLRENWEEWLLVVALNPSHVPSATITPLSALGLKGPHHAFEFWTQSYLGIVSERLTLEQIPAGGCAVVAMRRVRDEPQIVGTSLHVTMGAADLQDVRLQRDGPSLRATVTAAGERHGRITIATPKGWAAGSVRGTGGFFHTRPRIEGLVEVELSFRDVAEFQLTFWDGSRGNRP